MVRKAKFGVNKTLCMEPGNIKLKCYDGKIIKPVGQQILKCELDKKAHRLLLQIVNITVYAKS